MIQGKRAKVVMSMRAVRCTFCGETRWSLFSDATDEVPCEVCGGPTVPERRRPGAGPAILPAERRTRFVGAVARRPRDRRAVAS